MKRSFALVGPLVVLAVLTTAASGEATEAGQAEKKAEARQVPETLFEEDFTALDLFEGIKKLRPRVRVEQGATIDQDYGSADVDRYQSRLRTSVGAPLSKSVAIRFVGEVSAAYFDFDGDRSFLDTNRSGDPFDELLSTQMRVEGRYQFAETWAVVGGTEFSSRWEAGSEYQRGIEQSGFFGMAHLFRERFSAVVGLGVGSRMSRSGVSLSPLVQLGWRVTDDLEIETEGRGAKIAMRLNPGVTVFLRGGLTSTRSRLGDRGGKVNRGVLRERQVPIRLGGRWKIAKHWRLDGFAGAVFYSQYTVYDNDGNRVSTESSKSPAFTGQLSLERRF